MTRLVEPELASATGPPEWPAARRRLGLGLMLWGATGLVILVAALGFVNGVFAGDAGPLGLEGQRRQLVRLLDASETALEGAEVAARNADDSLVGAGGAADTAASFMQELAGTMNQLAGSLRISILGSQPFAAVADDFDRVAASAGRVATDLSSAATGIRLGGEDMGALAAELSDMGDEISRMRSGMTELLDTRGWQALASIAIAWLAVPAVVSLLVGYRWWRFGDRPRRTVRAAPTEVRRAPTRTPIPRGE